MFFESQEHVLHDPATIPYRFGDALPTEAEQEARFRANPIAATWIGRRRFSWGQEWHRAPLDVLRMVFSEGELHRMAHVCSIESTVSRHYEECHPLAWKVANCHWQCGYEQDYAALVRSFDGLRRLSFADMKARLAYVWKYNMQGYAEQRPDLVESADKRSPGSDSYVWIDGAFGLFVYDSAGKHVLTIGFNVAEEGVLVAQVQVREKRGNRWLYKLGAHYLDIAIDGMAKAFDGNVWLVDGVSAASAVRKSYGSGECGLTQDGERRIAALYDRDLAHFNRGEERKRVHLREFVRLYEKR